MWSKKDTSGQTFTERARRAQILDAACEVIAEVGYPRASVARIAEHIGAAKGVVLYHFKTKDALVTALVTDVMAAGAAAIAAALQTETTAAGALAAYIRANAMFLDAHRAASVAMFEIIGAYRTPDGLRFDQAAAADTSPPEQWAAVLDPAEIFRRGIDAGEFDPDLDPVLVRNALRGALDGAATEIARNRDYDVVTYAETLVTVFDRATRRPR